MKRLFWVSPLVLLIAGCAAPVQQDPTISEWQREGLLPPTGVATSRVYPETASYPAEEPNIVVKSNESGNSRADVAVADVIRQQLEYDRGLAPSLEHVTIVLQNGRIFLRGTVKSDLDARVIVDNLRNIMGVSQITDQLEIDPNV
ncbi:MAG TPA: BON domain-containing protein [Verrucomicrobiae bacterium]|nr:BON domain-containing protein [Verrucomicrobiae bacterium]